MPNQTLLLELGERGERLFKGFVRRRVETADAEIDDMERIEAEIPQIVVNGVDNLLA